MKRYYYILLFALSAFISGCGAVSYTARSLDELALDEKTKGVIYNLPQTEVLIRLEVTETQNHKGPFSKYAGKYFGNINAVKSDDKSYQISHVEILHHSIIDPSAYFLLQSNDKSPAQGVSLTSEGFLNGINSTCEHSRPDVPEFSFITTEVDEERISYAELALRSVREIAYDTLYKEVFRDSVFVREPYIKQKFVYKTPEKQAQELADIIFLLRDDRNALLKGENDGDQIPDGEALQIMVRELNQLEKEYMSLFTGYKTQSVSSHVFSLVPQKGDSVSVICRFSERYGILPVETSSGELVTITYDVPKPNLEMRLSAENKTENGLKYRIPVSAEVKLASGGNELAKTFMTINQFGVIQSLSEKFGSGTSINLYPYSGMLKSISRNQEK